MIPEDLKYVSNAQLMAEIRRRLNPTEGEGFEAKLEVTIKLPLEAALALDERRKE